MLGVDVKLKKHIANFYEYFRIIVILTAVIGLFAAGCGHPKRDAEIYLIKAEGLGNVLVQQCSSFVSLAKMYDSVWEYSKVTHLDFKSAYDEMMANRPGGLTLEMEVNKQRITRMLDLSKDPPKEMQKVHERLKELYDMYLQFHAFIVKFPSLSQEKYGEEINIYIKDINDIKTELEQLITEARKTIK